MYQIETETLAQKKKIFEAKMSIRSKIILKLSWHNSDENKMHNNNELEMLFIKK